jgi:hypothetical protein
MASVGGVALGVAGVVALSRNPPLCSYGCARARPDAEVTTALEVTAALGAAHLVVGVVLILVGVQTELVPRTQGPHGVGAAPSAIAF